MISNLIKDIREMDEKISKFMLKGLNFSASICFISLLILIAFRTYPTSFTNFYASLTLFRTGIFFAVGFVISGFVIDKLKKHMA